MLAIGAAVGAPNGIVAGQAWECEKSVSLAEYQRAKTGALFAAATELGAIAAGMAPDCWRSLGENIGEAYQVADDIRDATGDAIQLGKPVGRDVALGRPSATRELGLDGALQRLRHLVEGAIASIPSCPGAEELRRHIIFEAESLVPQEVARRAA
jgi:geranylgeranyl diphosphate synthase type II